MMAEQGDEPGGAPIALVTGVGRAIGIGAAVAKALVDDDWRVLAVGWRAYDERMPWGADADTICTIEADLGDPDVPAELFRHANDSLGTVSALVCCHAESVDSSIRDTTVESF